MKKLFFTIIILALAFCIAYIILQKNGFNDNAIINIPKTIDITVSCSEIRNLIVTSEADITISNSSSRSYNNVTIRVTGYDKNGDITKAKSITLDRTLEPNSSLTRPVTFPARTKSCKCVIESSN
jgi:hypothetical protein